MRTAVNQMFPRTNPGESDFSLTIPVERMGSGKHSHVESDDILRRDGRSAVRQHLGRCERIPARTFEHDDARRVVQGLERTLEYRVPAARNKRYAVVNAECVDEHVAVWRGSHPEMADRPWDSRENPRQHRSHFFLLSRCLLPLCCACYLAAVKPMFVESESRLPVKGKHHSYPSTRHTPEAEAAASRLPNRAAPPSTPCSPRARPRSGRWLVHTPVRWTPSTLRLQQVGLMRTIEVVSNTTVEILVTAIAERSREAMLGAAIALLAFGIRARPDR